MTCAHFGWDQICTQVKVSFSPFGHPTQVNASWVTPINLLLTNEIQDVCFEMGLFATCVYLWGNLPVRLATQRKSLRKFNLPLLATTCESFWPRLYNSKTVKWNPFFVSSISDKQVVVQCNQSLTKVLRFKAHQSHLNCQTIWTVSNQNSFLRKRNTKNAIKKGKCTGLWLWLWLWKTIRITNDSEKERLYFKRVTLDSN